ncbi:hypothetical protein ACJX0J_041804, partial [Zea mays]
MIFGSFFLAKLLFGFHYALHTQIHIESIYIRSLLITPLSEVYLVASSSNIAKNCELTLTCCTIRNLAYCNINTLASLLIVTLLQVFLVFLKKNIIIGAPAGCQNFVLLWSVYTSICCLVSYDLQLS